jgi:hypothetical protein
MGSTMIGIGLLGMSLVIFARRETSRSAVEARLYAGILFLCGMGLLAVDILPDGAAKPVVLGAIAAGVAISATFGLLSKCRSDTL